MRSKPRKHKQSEFEWHLWFAWRPVRINIDSARWQWVWLENVERLCEQDGLDWKWRYRLDSGRLVRHDG